MPGWIAANAVACSGVMEKRRKWTEDVLPSGVVLSSLIGAPRTLWPENEMERVFSMWPSTESICFLLTAFDISIINVQVKSLPCGSMSEYAPISSTNWS